jgi:uncharacterized protein (TIGR03083 family)
LLSQSAIIFDELGGRPVDIDHPELIQRESRRIIEAYVANPDGNVPWSDRWRVGTVARHVAGTHHVVAQVIAGRPDADFGLFASLASPEKNDPSFPDWFAQGTGKLLTELRSVEPDVACWNFRDGREGRVGFWARRMLHECVVHRWDAQMGAVGAADPIEPDIAIDGIDEFLEVFVDATRSQVNAPAGPTVLIETRDSSASWTAELPVGGRTVRRGTFDADIQVRGNASDILLLLWGRMAEFPDSVEVIGPVSDPRTLAALLPPL